MGQKMPQPPSKDTKIYFGEVPRKYEKEEIDRVNAEYQHESDSFKCQVNTMVSLPDDIIGFIYNITCDLQKHRSKTPKQLDEMFQQAYRIYSKYKVDPIYKNKEG